MVIIKLKKIAVHETVYEQLRNLGKTGDSFNDVITKLLQQQQQHRKEDEKHFVTT